MNLRVNASQAAQAPRKRMVLEQRVCVYRASAPPQPALGSRELPSFGEQHWYRKASLDRFTDLSPLLGNNDQLLLMPYV